MTILRLPAFGLLVASVIAGGCGGDGEAGSESGGGSASSKSGSGGHAHGSGGEGDGGSGASSGVGGGTGCGDKATLAPSTWAVQFAEAVMERWPSPLQLSNRWEYNGGIVFHAMAHVHRRTGDPKILAYLQTFADAFVDEDGEIDLPSEHNFDEIQPSILLPYLFEETGDERYATAAGIVRDSYGSIPKNADGGYWHKQKYPNQMWLDSIYMGQPFLARYGAVFSSCGDFCFDTPVEQSLLIADHVADPATGLLYHAWDQSKDASWADASTGRSPILWGRAMGWYAMALVDILGDLPKDHAGRPPLLARLRDLAVGLEKVQDPSGLWYQVPDRGDDSDDWLETSCTGMFVYALKVGVDRGYLDASYLAVAKLGWEGLKTRLSVDGGGLASVTGAVEGMGVQDDYENYVNKPALTDSPHGLCAVMMAASEMEAVCP